MRRRMVRRSALLIVCVLAAPAFGVRATPALAATASAFVVDKLYADSSLPSGADHVIQAFHDPGDANIHVSWTGSELAITADPVEGSFLSYALGSGTDAPFSAGTFNSANVNGCTGSVTIHAIEPALQVGVPTELTTLSASFERACGTETVFGEVRFHHDGPYAALGATHSPGQPWQLSLSGAGKSFVGRRTDPSTVTLKNLGTVPLTLGSLGFDPAPKASWTVSANSCTGSLAPGATCAITGTAVAWIPGGYGDYLTLPVSTERGKVRIYAPSAFGAARFVPIDPVRLVDTRVGLGISSSLKTGVARTFTVVDRFPADEARNIPAEAVAVTGNVVLTKSTTAGYGALTTTLSNNPAIRTVYVPTGDTRGNGVITRLSEQGTLGLTWLGGAGSSSHAIFEATGYFVPTVSPSPLRSGNFRGNSPPWRVVNTTTAQGISSRLIAGQPRTFVVPLVGVDQESTAVAGVVTVLTPKQGGYLSIGSTPVTAPKTAVLHFRANESRTNSLIAKLGSSSQAPNTLSITYVGAAGSSVDVLFDVHGTFGSGQAGFVPLVPNRVVDSAAAKGLTGPLSARVKRVAGVVNRVPNDPSRNIPPDKSTGDLLFKAGLVGNLWMVRPMAAGALGAVPPVATIPPATWAIRAPARDRRALGLILGTAGGGVGMTLYYSASAGATTNVQFDVTGYFLTH